MRSESTTYHVQFIGPIWMPAVVCASERTYRVDDLHLDQFENEIDAIEDKLGIDTGDFQNVTDFRCEKVRVVTSWKDNVTRTRTQRDVVKDWDSKDNELKFMDSMYPSED